MQQSDRVEIALAGDSRGNAIGTVSTDSGTRGIAGAKVCLRGNSPLGEWQRSAVTDRNGFFSVPVPLGSAGPITATLADPAAAAAVVDAGDLSLSLTPPPTEDGHRMSLCGAWQFLPDPPADVAHSDQELAWREIRVPSHWEMEGFRCESGRGAFRRSLALPDDWSGKRIKLRTDGVYSSSELWLNGRRVGGRDGGMSPFEVDITDAARPGEDNTLVVLVTARSRASDIDNASIYAYFELAGIWRPTEVFAVEPAHISRLVLETRFDEAYTDARLLVAVTLANESHQAVTGAPLAMQVTAPGGEQVDLRGLETTVTLGAWETREVILTAEVASPAQWNAEQPRLYCLRAAFAGSRTEEAFGFRQVDVTGNRFLINGQPARLFGVCLHDAHPLDGRALSETTVRQDVSLIKEANFNAIRTSHYPPHPLTPRIADELGLYVEDEAPCCFVYAEPQSWLTATERHDITSDLRYAPLYISTVSAYVERDRNRPSVIDWSICNESDYRGIFWLAYEFIRASDPSRPCTASWSTPDSPAEMITYHHPVSVDNIRQTSALPKPAFFDECFGLFHGWGNLALALDVDPGLRDYWVTGVPEIVQATIETENQVGTMLWAWADDKFLVPGTGINYWRRDQVPIHFADSIYKLPGRGIQGEHVWGVVDGWRRPLPYFWHAKKVLCPIQVPNRPLALPQPGQPIRVPVENRNVFTDLGQYACRWRVGEEHGELRAAVPPRSSGTVDVPVARQPSVTDVLELEFRDETGRIVATESLRFVEQKLPEFTPSGTPAVVRDEGVRYLDGSSRIRLLGRETELAYDRTSGSLMWAIAGGEQVLSRGPTLHILKADAPADAFPVGWRFAEGRAHTEGGSAVLEWRGAFESGFEGRYTICMDDSGHVEFGYEFACTGPDLVAREIGLEFETPLAFDTLEWERRAEHSWYPPDHIGRPVGRVVAHPNLPQPAQARPHALVDHPFGCNDFRSAKRNILRASLENGMGQGVEVISDGRQHVRATVGLHGIALKVLDSYSGIGSNEAWIYHYGPGVQVRSGEVLSGRVRLRLLTGRRSPR